MLVRACPEGRGVVSRGGLLSRLPPPPCWQVARYEAVNPLWRTTTCMPTFGWRVDDTNTAAMQHRVLQRLLPAGV
jgi:hypothetical protein